VLLHTHLSENLGEIAAVAARFTDEADYLDVYDRFGLVGNRSVFAHCIQMDDARFGRMAAKPGRIAFCPTSNLFLGSGLFDLDKAVAHGVGSASAPMSGRAPASRCSTRWARRTRSARCAG
jgi:guanine deaminase